MRVDCDQDAILLKVRQAGAACHTGRTSCFYRRIDTLDRLSGTDQDLI
jgi:phosphoribosyl-AMP cyclohydrolase